jgi:uncharacterized protein YndB with AHSA1/START domain
MITVETIIAASIEKVWEFWTTPEHIVKWNNATEDWYTPYAENDLKEGGKFKYTMASKDGTISFDLEGIYTQVIPLSAIKFTLADGRKVNVTFEKKEKGVLITEKFEAETENSKELQQQGWQAILDNFKKYTENNSN